MERCHADGDSYPSCVFLELYPNLVIVVFYTLIYTSWCRGRFALHDLIIVPTEHIDSSGGWTYCISLNGFSKNLPGKDR
jgi:hypothetical protein